jgi:hypothetical protein
LESIAIDMRMTKNGVMKMRDRLIDRGLLVKGFRGKVKTSAMYNSVYRVDEKTYNSVQKRPTEYTSNVQLSIPKNNNRLTKNNSGFFCYKHTDNFVPAGKVCGYC